MTPDEISKLTRVPQKTIDQPSVHVRKRPQKDDSGVVYMGDEFIGVLYRDDEDHNDLSYNFQMAILDFDLE